MVKFFIKNKFLQLFIVFILLSSCTSINGENDFEDKNLIGKEYSDTNEISKKLKIDMRPRPVKRKIGHPLKIEYVENMWSFVPVASLMIDENEIMIYYYENFFCVFSMQRDGKRLLKGAYKIEELDIHEKHSLVDDIDIDNFYDAFVLR